MKFILVTFNGLSESSGACICTPLDDDFDDIVESIGKLHLV